MSATEVNNTTVQSTSDYWGFRELEANEVNHVSGGDGCGGGWGDYAGAIAANECNDNNANLLAGFMQSITAGPLATGIHGINAYANWCSGY